MRPKRKYLIRVEDESRLTGIAEWRFSRRSLILMIVMALPVLFIIAGMLIMATPLRNLLPGYLKEEERSSTVETLLRLDSLHDAHRRNQQYLHNFFTVVDVDREPDDTTGMTTAPASLTVDSLLVASDAERKFVRMMEQREKYNISILAPLAAEGMVFSDPVAGGSVTEASRHSERAEVMVPRGAVVCALTEGRVVDVEYSPSEGGYSVVIQHGKGFMSRTSRLGYPLVGAGEKVTGGTVLSASGAGRNGSISLQIWRNGDPLVPFDLIGEATASGEKVAVVDSDVGRGR